MGLQDKNINNSEHTQVCVKKRHHGQASLLTLTDSQYPLFLVKQEVPSVSTYLNFIIFLGNPPHEHMLEKIFIIVYCKCM